MNKTSRSWLGLLVISGAVLLLLASYLGDRLGGNKNNSGDKDHVIVTRPEPITPSLSILRLRREVLKSPVSKPDDFHLPAPKAGSKTGALSNQEIEEAIANRLALFQRCWTQRLHETPSLSGRTLLQFEITPRGKVQDVQVVESTLNDDVMLRCLESVLERISFREFDGGSITLTFPLSFE